MTPGAATAFLVALLAGLFLLPVLPAILELRLRRDAEPLSVIQQHAGEVRHFALAFRDYVRRLEPQLRQCAAAHTNLTLKVPGGDECLLLGVPEFPAGLPAGSKDILARLAVEFVVLSAGDLELPGGRTFLKEIYAAGNLRGGQASTYRAILCEAEVRLASASRVLRWVHARGALRAAEDSELFGRASSDMEVLMEAGCVFQRVNAPRILAVSHSGALPHRGRFAHRPGAPEPHVSVERGRRIVERDFEIPPEAVLQEDLVARGELRVGAGAIVLGSVKGNRDIHIERGARIEGSLICSGIMRIAADCRIRGPVIAERALRVGSGSELGTAAAQTTVSAPRIEIEEGALIHGTLWAREAGHVVPGGCP